MMELINTFANGSIGGNIVRVVIILILLAIILLSILAILYVAFSALGYIIECAIVKMVDIFKRLWKGVKHHA